MRSYGLIEKAITERTGAKVRTTTTPAKDAAIFRCTWLYGVESREGEITLKEGTKDIVVYHETLDSYPLETILQLIEEYIA